MFSKKHISYNPPNHRFFRPTLNRCSPVNFLHIFRTLFSKNTYGGLLLSNDHSPLVFAITGHTNNLILHCNKYLINTFLINPLINTFSPNKLNFFFFDFYLNFIKPKASSLLLAHNYGDISFDCLFLLLFLFFIIAQ